jgi:hypothetical protein
MKTGENETSEFAGLLQRVRTVDIAFTGHKVEGTKHPCKKVKKHTGTVRTVRYCTLICSARFHLRMFLINCARY